MDGWMDGWKDDVGWMDGWIDRWWMDGLARELNIRRALEQTYGRNLPPSDSEGGKSFRTFVPELSVCSGRAQGKILETKSIFQNQDPG